MVSVVEEETAGSWGLLRGSWGREEALPGWLIGWGRLGLVVPLWREVEGSFLDQVGVCWPLGGTLRCHLGMVLGQPEQPTYA